MKIKSLIISLLVLGLVNSLFAQDYSKLDKTVLKEKTDYVENENLVIECSNYLLNSPLDDLKNDLNHVKALLFIMRWMEGTPDYMFDIDDTVGKATKSNPSLLGVYLASMSKYVLENKDKSGDAKEVKYNSFLIFIKYCEDPKNNVRKNKEIKKLIEAKDEGTLREYLNT